MGKKRLTDREFQKLTEKIKNTIIANEGLVGDQVEQIKTLLSYERSFRNDVWKHGQAIVVYKKFINMMQDGNILSAQSYFREKSNIFRKHISPALKERNARALKDFDINFQLVQFIVENWEGVLPERSAKFYEKIVTTRNILIENNLPLAINRAKIFYKKTPRSHLSLLDLIDICVCGLIAGVDKFVGEDYSNWAGVGIGRMVGFMIQEYSESFIRLFPKDKKILYRANALKHRMKIEKMEDLVDAVNESFEKDKEKGMANIPKLPITEIQIRTLMNSSNYVSAEAHVKDGSDDDEGGTIYDYTAHPDSTEDIIEKKDAMEKVINTSKDLEIIERKVIKLKGVDL